MLIVIKLGSNKRKNMKKKIYQMTNKLFIYPGEVAWHFLSISRKEGKEIKENFGKIAKGFGSLPVEVAIGKTKWQTSIFPEKISGSYLLPIKATVRKKEELDAGEEVTYKIKILI